VSADDTNRSVVASPNKGTTSTLIGVSCASATSCEAAGNYANGRFLNRTLIESWNGIVWTVAASPNQGTSLNFLDSMSCVSPTSCAAAGYYLKTGHGLYPLIESNS
jgi:hypothetical protein